MNETKLRKWAIAHGKNPNNIVKRYKKMNLIERQMFNEEIKNEQRNKENRPTS